MRGRPDREDWWAIGIITAIVSIIWFSFLYSTNPTVKYIVADIQNWQTMIAAILAAAAALTAASWTVSGIRDQIEESRQSRIDEELRQFCAERSRLPKALSEIVAYSERCLWSLKPILDFYENNPETTNLPTAVSLEFVPTYPTDAADQLSALISVCPGGKNAGNDIANLLHALQINHSRLDRLAIRKEHKIFLCHNLLGHICDAIEIKRVADSFFDFARNIKSDTELTDAFLQEIGAAHLFVEIDFPFGFEEKIQENYRSNILSLGKRH